MLVRPTNVCTCHGPKQQPNLTQDYQDLWTCVCVLMHQAVASTVFSHHACYFMPALVLSGCMHDALKWCQAIPIAHAPCDITITSHACPSMSTSHTHAISCTVIACVTAGPVC